MQDFQFWVQKVDQVEKLFGRPIIREGATRQVPKVLLDADKVRRQLTIPNGAYWGAVQNGLPSDLDPTLDLFSEDENYFYVPRHYKLPLLAGVTKPMFVRDSHLSHVERLEHNITLRNETQIRASAALLEDTKDKILSLSCGKGKTVVSLHAASNGFRFPLLVVVHTTALMTQWRERIKQFYNITDDDIGHVQGPWEIWKTKRVAVGMLHSLVLKDYPPAFYKYWKLVIFDECHKLGADLFSRACTLFPGERWGLSATVERSDGMEKVIKLHLGKIAYLDLKQDLKSKIYFVHTKITTNERRFRFRRGRVNMARLTNWLSENDDRNEIISRYVKEAAGKGRTILVLGERLRQLYDLCEACPVESKAVYVGSMKEDERKEALKKQVVFATQHLAKEGLDRPQFDTLLILIAFGAKGRLQQSIGRIERAVEGKKDPLVIIFYDNIGIIGSLKKKMEDWFHKNGYQVKNIIGRN